MQFREELLIPHNPPDTPPDIAKFSATKPSKDSYLRQVSRNRRGRLTFVAVSRPIKEAR
jgi:hypothetical protein